VSKTAAAPRSTPHPNPYPYDYPEALYAWAWSHGAYFGTDPIGLPAPQPTGRKVALIIRALTAAPTRLWRRPTA
jgi:hypothetical protein